MDPTPFSSFLRSFSFFFIYLIIYWYKIQLKIMITTSGKIFIDCHILFHWNRSFSPFIYYFIAQYNYYGNNINNYCFLLLTIDRIDWKNDARV